MSENPKNNSLEKFVTSCQHLAFSYKGSKTLSIPGEKIAPKQKDAKAMFLKNIAAQSSPGKGLQNSQETFEALSKAEKASLAKSLEEEEETFAVKFKEFAATATPKTLVNYLRGMCQTSSMPESDANYDMQNGAANDENYLDEDMESECDNYFWEGDEDFEADYEEDFRTKPEEDFDNGYDGGLNDTQLTDDFQADVFDAWQLESRVAKHFVIDTRDEPTGNVFSTFSRSPKDQKCPEAGFLATASFAGFAPPRSAASRLLLSRRKSDPNIIATMTTAGFGFGEHRSVGQSRNKTKKEDENRVRKQQPPRQNRFSLRSDDATQ
ncbi:unnamed protein product [Notodromas monacha]|uniref:Uncharacterized protein n=1 Tax=Notodromas monacha TaxID=399045 RepID=A0A7R9BYC4_9CRUS|nr:unnamed protein product [Notodromas monacha]CAG0922682.1 unnamed protein product [Notodromas monacha]